MMSKLPVILLSLCLLALPCAGSSRSSRVIRIGTEAGSMRMRVLQLPLYPMLDCEDTESSADNHGRVWNTRRNHWGWKHYLGEMHGNTHAFDMLLPWQEQSKAAKRRLCEEYERHMMKDR